MELNETQDSRKEATRTTNKAGGEAFEVVSPELNLYKRTLNNLLEDTYYESDTEQYSALVNAFDEAAEENPEFVLKLAAYARQEMGLRDVPQILLALAAKDSRFVTHPPEPGHHNDTRIRDWTPQIVQRMDEAATVLSIYQNQFEKNTLPHGLKQGLSDAINQMADEYTLAKYRLESRKVTLYDVFNHVHPNPESSVENWHDLTKADRKELFERFMLGSLDEHETVEDVESPDTWEVVISEKGNTEEAWYEVLPKMGIMAKIRNIRNMLEAGVNGDDIFDSDDLSRARNTKMFPFRFYQSYKAYKNAVNNHSSNISKNDEIERFLEKAIDITAENLPEEFENTLVVADISGSMRNPVSNRSNLDCMEISTFFTAVAGKRGADTGVFARDFQTLQFHTDTPSLARMDKLQSADVGGSTNGWKVFETIRSNRKGYNNIVLLTDMQLWNSSGYNTSFSNEFHAYQEQINPDVQLYLIDLQSYGDLVTPEGEPNVHNISGWSTNILEYISRTGDEEQAIKDIKNWNL